MHVQAASTGSRSIPDMNARESECVSDYQLVVDNYHEYIVEQLNKYMQQHSYSNMYEQGIDTIRPRRRPGYNTPARQSSSIMCQ